MMQSNNHQKPEIYYAIPCRPRFIEARVSTFVALTRNVTRFGVSSVESIRGNAAYPLIDPRQPDVIFDRHQCVTVPPGWLED